MSNNTKGANVKNAYTQRIKRAAFKAIFHRTRPPQRNRPNNEFSRQTNKKLIKNFDSQKLIRSRKRPGYTNNNNEEEKSRAIRGNKMKIMHYN